MAAEPLEELRARAQRTVQVERRDRAARPLPEPVVAGDAGRQAGCSARRAATRRCRSRLRASPRPRRRRRCRRRFASGHSSTCAIAARRILLLDRLTVAVQLLEPVGEPARLVARPSVSSSSSAARGWPSRPAALMRGASRNADLRRRRRPPGSTRATFINACSPGFCVRASARRPAIASERFSPTSGTTSAIVASATRSRWRREHLRVDAEERLAELVDDARCRRAPGTDSPTDASRRSGSPGSSSPGRWWSVTITSSPSSRARRDLVHGGDAAVDGQDEAAPFVRRGARASAPLTP